MNFDRLSFVEAIEDLAARMGVEVPREQSTVGAPAPVSDDLYSLMAKVATFYGEQLGTNERARGYAAKRGLDAATLGQFAIGYAPDSWNEVLKRFGASDASRAQADGNRIDHRTRERRRSLRPVPRPADVSHPRCTRPRDRLWRPRTRPGRAQVPQLARNPAVSQGTRAIRPVRSSPATRAADATDRGRGLHGRGAPAPERHPLRGGDAGHGDHSRTSQARVSCGQRNHLLF